MDRPIIQNQDLDGSSFFLKAQDNNHRVDIGILLFHGFTATTVEVRPLAEFLRQSGYSVMGPLLPGHGTKPEEMLPIRYQDWLDTAENSYHQLKKQHTKIVVGGESMGALLAFHLAALHPDIAAAVAFAPAIHVAGQWRAPFLAPFIKFQPKYYLPKNMQPAELDTLPWQGYNVLPIPAVAQFYQLQKLVRRELIKVCQPALIFQGKLDTTIDPLGAETVLDELGSSEKQVIWLEHSRHTLLLGPEHLNVFSQTLAFIQRVTI